jgi:hypothetical protein
MNFSCFCFCSVQGPTGAVGPQGDDGAPVRKRNSLWRHAEFMACLLKHAEFMACLLKHAEFMACLLKHAEFMACLNQAIVHVRIHGNT